MIPSCSQEDNSSSRLVVIDISSSLLDPGEGCIPVVRSKLIRSGTGATMCNFVVHDRCLKTVVSPCSSIAATLVKNKLRRELVLPQPVSLGDSVNQKAKEAIRMARPLWKETTKVNNKLGGELLQRLREEARRKRKRYKIYLYPNPVAHCWSEPIHHKRKFCNVCRKRLEDSLSIHCESNAGFLEIRNKSQHRATKLNTQFPNTNINFSGRIAQGVTLVLDWPADDGSIGVRIPQSHYLEMNLIQVNLCKR
uniref:Uncharacterized protein n=1 Tax=Timema poppense TaxID=170557 RepID=A0A7R9CT51_TIMPO|nr:unnamed protein product [Timema poppensis]